MRSLGLLNEALRFVLEVVLLLVFVVFGASLGGNLISGLAGGFVFGVAFVLVWGLFAAPKRRYPTPEWVPSALFVGLGAVAALMLVALGNSGAAIFLVVLVLANESMLQLGVRTISREAPRR